MSRYDPTEHDDEIVPPCDPAELMSCPSKDDGVAYFRIQLIGLTISSTGKYGDISRFQTVKAKEALLRLFATFPFRIVNVTPNGIYQIDAPGWHEAFEAALKSADTEAL